MRGHCLGHSQKKQQAMDKENSFFFTFSEYNLFIDKKKNYDQPSPSDERVSCQVLTIWFSS